MMIFSTIQSSRPSEAALIATFRTLYGCIRVSSDASTSDCFFAHIFPSHDTECGFRSGSSEYSVFRFLRYVVFYCILLYGYIVVIEGGVIRWNPYEMGERIHI